ncbi:hypothetical protein ABMA28_013128 [Loxostege sticticalis]|uniref:Endonuclease/exonuclease/phosphatase domain-containing protein n=1 Tax=Loxostege sticticalis TaxID=481309 RepID=A0ABD0S3P6_LOXSC
MALDIAAVYKPENANDQDFIDIFSQQLLRKRRAIIFGDFNYDLLKRSQSTTAYKQMLKENGFAILNKIDPQYCTRETATSRTIIDHVSTNIKNNNFRLSIVNSLLSDHKLLFLEIDKLVPEEPVKVQYTAIDYNKLSKCIETAQFPDYNNEYNVIEQTLKKAIENSKIIKNKILNPPKNDWINKDIIEAINKRNQLGYIHIRSQHNETAREEYLRQRRIVQKMIQQTKSTYYQKLFKTCSGSPIKVNK